MNKTGTIADYGTSSAPVSQAIMSAMIYMMHCKVYLVDLLCRTTEMEQIILSSTNVGISSYGNEDVQVGISTVVYSTLCGAPDEGLATCVSYTTRNKYKQSVYMQTSYSCKKQSHLNPVWLLGTFRGSYSQVSDTAANLKSDFYKMGCHTLQ